MVGKYLDLVSIFLGFSFHVLLVIRIERYIGVFYPIFHLTSVTRYKLLTLLAITLTLHTILHMISTYGTTIPWEIVEIIFLVAVFVPLMYLNLKLYKMSRKMRRRKKVKEPEKIKRTMNNLKNISTCLLAVACLLVLSIPTSVAIVINMNAENRHASKAILSNIWTTTIYLMNCTFNSLIFFWKNKVLRTEGIKILKTLKDRLVGSWVRNIQANNHRSYRRNHRPSRVIAKWILLHVIELKWGAEMYS